jgi:integrase/recombinase XerD
VPAGLVGSLVVPAEKWPILVRHERAAEWLRVWADLGRAARTIEAYARGLAEFLEVCEREGVDPVRASRADVAVFVRALMSRPGRHGSNVVSIDSGSGLANATLQQRLVPVRLFFDYLIEEGLRDSNPVGRGPVYPRAPVRWTPAGPGAEVDEAAVDSERGRVAGAADGVPRGDGAESADARVGV